MSLWSCPTHGLVGPVPCCITASLARFPTPFLDQCNANYRARIAREEAEELRVAELESQRDKLAEALRQIAETWEDCDTYTLGLIARDMLTVCGLRKS